MSTYTKYYEAVNDIRKYIIRDLVGPVNENEALENVEPINTYVCGILWPKKVDIDTSTKEDDDAKIPSDDENPEDPLAIMDDSISSANVYKPTSMGISIIIPQKVTSININFSCARYFHEEFQKDDRNHHRYSRKPLSLYIDAKIHDKLGSKQILNGLESGIEIVLSLRHIFPKGDRLITITVQNSIHVKQKVVEQSTNALFQCKLVVASDVPLLPIYNNNALVVDSDEKIVRLQYREKNNYAYGHGCSVVYEEEINGVFTVSSDFLPTALVHQMMPGGIINHAILNLSFWRSASRDEACEQLSQFIGEYTQWRQNQEIESKPIHDEDYHQAIELVLTRIDECINRLSLGVDVLKNNNHAWQAFILMNEAMLLQRIKTKRIDEKDVNWYPFQLAYILEIIPDIINETSQYRKAVDLLWFPTGGGKTEAYLGVAAFTIFYRRLMSKIEADGVTVIMRYTLRLLTIQQFERATALICACEHIRNREQLPGGEISIGLWIGSSMTPNRIEQAEEVLNKLKANPNERIFEGNPVQVTKCPWCGHRLDLNSYNIVGSKLIISCADNTSCEFHTKLPIYVVDDDIYRVRPTLLLSTIDKFARIAWDDNTRNLFGNHCPPPELIIQDELHLISGPLGSLTGVYEIALEYLCGQAGKSPKIIASTATIKNARAQIRNLYNRSTIQFPPAGINFDDSFFAVLASTDQRPARTYIGLCEMGGSIADLLIRIFATLFFAKALFKKQNKDDSVIDQYYTTVGYFNALKDLGSSSSIIQDRIFTHIRNQVSRTFRAEAEQFKIVPGDVKVFEHSELTSRKSSKEIRDTLDQLTWNYKNPACFSYVLASNMLSVGIDIDRLGVMTVFNQPKSNAEYIQATSRIGRQNPGIVLAMYNNMRSRDKSHYEQFRYYHDSFYRYVEATSVTPFSMRTLDKALHCVFVALVRLSIPSLSANEAARHFQSDDPRVVAIRNYLVNRIDEVMPNSTAYASEILQDFSEDWEAVAKENHNTLFYKSYTGNPSLLTAAEEESDLGLPKILNSLRNVDPTANVYFRR